VARNRGYYEQVGTYDPMPNDRNEKLVALNMDRIKYWLSQDCSTSKPVSRLLGLAGIFPTDENTLKQAESNRQKIVEGNTSVNANEEALKKSEEWIGLSRIKKENKQEF